jgi:hypothetical protein
LNCRIFGTQCRTRSGPRSIAGVIERLARATKFFAWMSPGEARVFPTAELERAKAWVAGDAG